MEQISILLNKLKEFSEKIKEFSEKLKDFLQNSRFRQLEMVTVVEKRPKNKPGVLLTQVSEAVRDQ